MDRRKMCDGDFSALPQMGDSLALCKQTLRNWAVDPERGGGSFGLVERDSKWWKIKLCCDRHGTLQRHRQGMDASEASDAQEKRRRYSSPSKKTGCLFHVWVEEVRCADDPNTTRFVVTGGNLEHNHPLQAATHPSVQRREAAAHPQNDCGGMPTELAELAQSLRHAYMPKELPLLFRRT